MNNIKQKILHAICLHYSHMHVPVANPGFQVRGANLKKIAPSGGRR